MINVGLVGDLVGQSWASPSFQLRLLLPWLPSPELRLIPLNLPGVDGPRMLRECDLLVFQRLSFAEPSGREMLSGAASMSIPTVLDIDDDFFALATLSEHEQGSEAAERVSILQGCLPSFACIWASTSTLAAALGHRGFQARVRPTLPPEGVVRTPGGTAHEIPEVLYFGTTTHLSDWEMVEGELSALVHEGALRVTCVGITTEHRRLKDGTRFISTEGGVVTRYPAFLDWVARSGPFDIGIAPLRQNDLNAAKSSLKVFEYAQMGLIPVASDTPGYSFLGDIGFERSLVRGAAENWRISLERFAEMKLAERHEYRAEIVRELQARARALMSEMLLDDLVDLQRLTGH